MVQSRVSAHLYTDGGGWGLPTIDADGLSAHALFRFCGLDYVASPDGSRSLTAEGELPVAVFSGFPSAHSSEESLMTAGLTSIISELAANKSLPDPNAHLTPFMAAESTAFVALIQSRLEPARFHELFVDNANYADIYPSLVTRDAAWPIKHFAPFIRRRSIRTKLAGSDADSSMEKAAIVIESLATRLGERNKFFYGDKPSVLDALVFGQLAVALMVPLARPRLRELVARHSNMVTFVERIYNTFFKDSIETFSNRLDVVEAAEIAREEAKQRMQEESRRNAAEERKREKRNRSKHEETEEERKRKEGNQMFIWMSVAMFAAHVLLENEIEINLE